MPFSPTAFVAGGSVNHTEMNKLGMQYAAAMADSAVAIADVHGEIAPLQGLAGVFRVAPDPTGVRATDTANIQALINELTGVGGLILLRAGTYKITTLANTRDAKIPNIAGMGVGVTILETNGSTSGGLTIEGHSGTHSGVVISDVTFSSATGAGVGLRFWAVCGAKALRVQFKNLSVGGLFHNNATGDFTEYCAFEDCYFEDSCPLAVEYRVNNGGAESFHGSGISGKSLINQPSGATGPSILINSGCFVYNAPLEVTFFARNTSQPLIRNQSSRLPMFHGVIRVEQFTDNCIIATTSTEAITLAGDVVALGATVLRLGALRQVERAFWNNAGYQIEPRPNFAKKFTTGVAGGFDVISWAADPVSGPMLVTVDIRATNYHYSRLLYCWPSPYDPTGVVTELAAPISLNTAGYGAPTFSIASYTLKVANGSYPSGVTCEARAISMPSSIFG